MNPATIIAALSLTVSFSIGIWNILISRENHKMKKIEFNREQNRYYKEMFDISPKFEILSSRKVDISNTSFSGEFDIDCLVIPIEGFSDEKNNPRFSYSEKVLNKKEWLSY